MHSPRLTDQHHLLAGSRERGVQQLAVEHDRVAGVHRNHHGRVLRTLAAMHRDRIRQVERSQRAHRVVHHPPLEVDLEDARGAIDARHRAHVAVEDAQIPVVATLDHAVPDTESSFMANDGVGRVRIEARLEGRVQGLDADRTPVHRHQHHYLSARVVAGLRQSLADGLDDRRCGVLGTLRADELEARLAAVQVRHLAMVNRVRVADDRRTRRLAERPLEPRHRQRPALDQVGQHLPGSDRGQLVLVADQHQLHLVRQRLEQRAHERQVDHAGLVGDHDIGCETALGVELEPASAGLRVEQLVDRLGALARALGHAPCRTSGRRSE